jgi:drug/metabolite transporter (DMT)-like permease
MIIYLIGSIVLTSYLLLSFKVCGKLNIPVFPAIVFNYMTCVITGSIVNGGFPIQWTSLKMPWFQWAMIMGVLFIISFNLIGMTAQKLGVAVASVANKLSLIIPVILSIILYHEQVVGWEIVGIILALLAVIFTCFPQKNQTEKDIEIPMLQKILLPTMVFIGSGFLDALINHVQQSYVTKATNNAFLISGFFSAASIGIIVLLYQYWKKQLAFNVNQVLAGICIGIPNYFSIWCLVQFLQDSPWETSASLPVNNMGIVLFSTLVAAILFKEKLSYINWIGIGLSVIAIYLIAFGNTF